MSILFFLTPKSAVSYIYDTDTILSALDTIRCSGYSAIPLINKSGKYIGAVSEGDFLWNYIDHHKTTSKETIESTPIGTLSRHTQYKAVNVNADINDLFRLVFVQNFVPVIDDRGIFIGIVTRKEILKHYCSCRYQEDAPAEAVSMPEREIILTTNKNRVYQ